MAESVPRTVRFRPWLPTCPRRATQGRYGRPEIVLPTPSASATTITARPVAATTTSTQTTTTRARPIRWVMLKTLQRAARTRDRDVILASRRRDSRKDQVPGRVKPRDDVEEVWLPVSACGDLHDGRQRPRPGPSKPLPSSGDRPTGLPRLRLTLGPARPQALRSEVRPHWRAHLASSMTRHWAALPSGHVP